MVEKVVKMTEDGIQVREGHWSYKEENNTGVVRAGCALQVLCVP